mmetsp:Transcript_171142/g.548540  ORF Transcript_171142/g.548540 Transcript_171142/m.548540 type:complete len:239 (+) Transcript_171142:1224-1940(+)
MRQRRTATSPRRAVVCGSALAMLRIEMLGSGTTALQSLAWHGARGSRVLGVTSRTSRGYASPTTRCKMPPRCSRGHPSALRCSARWGRKSPQRTRAMRANPMAKGRGESIERCSGSLDAQGHLTHLTSRHVGQQRCSHGPCSSISLGRYDFGVGGCLAFEIQTHGAECGGICIRAGRTPSARGRLGRLSSTERFEYHLSTSSALAGWNSCMVKVGLFCPVSRDQSRRISWSESARARM